MKAGPSAYNLIMRYEGFRGEAYKCPGGVWTVGFGSTTLITGERVKPDMTISFEEAIEVLEKEVRLIETQIEEHVRVQLNQGQFDALISFIYNVGIENFKKSTLLK